MSDMGPGWRQRGGVEHRAAGERARVELAGIGPQRDSRPARSPPPTAPEHEADAKRISGLENAIWRVGGDRDRAVPKSAGSADFLICVRIVRTSTSLGSSYVGRTARDPWARYPNDTRSDRAHIPRSPGRAPASCRRARSSPRLPPTWSAASNEAKQYVDTT
jgi:hypothetical protein